MNTPVPSVKPPPPPYVPTLNHGGPGICRLCYPNGATKQTQQTQQGEMLL